MKTYKLNNIEVPESALRELIRNNPELTKPVEEDIDTTPFFPIVGQEYFTTYVDLEVRGVTNQGEKFDNDNVSFGNCFRTEESAKRSMEIELAAVRIWKFVKFKGLYFKPDWSDKFEERYYIFINPDSGMPSVGAIFVSFNFYPLPYFRTREDAEMAVDACKDDYLLLTPKSCSTQKSN